MSRRFFLITTLLIGIRLLTYFPLTQQPRTHRPLTHTSRPTGKHLVRGMNPPRGVGGPSTTTDLPVQKDPLGKGPVLTNLVSSLD